jgi:allophanate hydrolase subunit 2
LQTFLESEYKLSTTSDRMGYRLEGPEIEHLQGADILSDGMLFGSVQVPASGQPIVMMSEHPTTGGYTKIASVVSADLPVLAQCAAGVSRIRFKTTTLEAAQKRYRSLLQGLHSNYEDSEEKQLDVSDSLFKGLGVKG